MLANRYGAVLKVDVGVGGEAGAWKQIGKVRTRMLRGVTWSASHNHCKWYG